ncbi:MAG: RdgB/HAM1 family non-canonical purine NTP pyrophosphatase [Candidatus Aenigmarchaeota archaeon]
MAVYFVTSNRNKFIEAGKILGFDIKQAKLEIPEIQSLNIKEITEDKARKAYAKLKKPLIVEDTALYIKSWKNFPGPLISWVIKTMGINGICKFTGKDRSAKAEACVAYYDGKRMKTFSGIIKGEISKRPRGRKRFDWDRIFIPHGFNKTFSEMELSEKNKISHRMKAFKKLKGFLGSKVK